VSAVAQDVYRSSGAIELGEYIANYYSPSLPRSLAVVGMLSLDFIEQSGQLLRSLAARRRAAA
jgi:hypothetical protein